ncbi:hypothetical protein J6590_053231 [Homalodisca vitripennis]|nr:hypothetical protein J6590_053231 [Homalodisca vitripennis]
MHKGTVFRPRAFQCFLKDGPDSHFYWVLSRPLGASSKRSPTLSVSESRRQTAGISLSAVYSISTPLPRDITGLLLGHKGKNAKLFGTKPSDGSTLDRWPLRGQSLRCLATPPHSTHPLTPQLRQFVDISLLKTSAFKLRIAEIELTLAPLQAHPGIEWGASPVLFQWLNLLKPLTDF